MLYTPTTKRRGLTSEFTRRNVTTERRMTITGTPSSLGDYTILVKAYNDLGACVNPVYLRFIIHVVEETEGIIQIENGDLKMENEVVYDLNGRQRSTLSSPLSTLPKGVYIVKTNEGGQAIQVK